MTEYPRWMHHPEKPAVLVEDPDEQAALGPGWHTMPKAWESGPPTETEPPKAKRK